MPVARTGLPTNMYHFAHCCSGQDSLAKSTPAYRSGAMWPDDAVGSMPRNEAVALKVEAMADWTAAMMMNRKRGEKTKEEAAIPSRGRGGATEKRGGESRV